MKIILSACCAALCLYAALLPAQPLQFQPRGIGGGGALFNPAISPFDHDRMFAVCDMTELFRSTDGGVHWDYADFREFTAANYSKVEFTSNPDVLFGLRLDFLSGVGHPVRSGDGSATWQPIVNPQPDGILTLFADPEATDRLMVSDWGRLYFSNDAGQSFTTVYDDNSGNFYVAGVFWDGNDIFLGTNYGLLASHDGGQSFNLENLAGLPAGGTIASFSGAKQNGLLRFFAVAAGEGDIYPTVPASDYLWSYQNVYRLNYGPGAAWQEAASDLPENHKLVKVAMARNSSQIAYAAGTNVDNSFPVVYKTTDGGNSWQQVLQTTGNANIATGWCGYQGDENWWYAEIPFGLSVASDDPDVAVFSDFGFLHRTTDGGASWRQMYVHPDSENPVGSVTVAEEAYRSNGLENTASWWMTWTDDDRILAAYTDIGGIRSDDGGGLWSFRDLDRSDNSTYQFLQHPATGTVYAATSTVHDLYQSTYLRDSRIDNGGGRVLYSIDAATWYSLLDFDHPVVALAADPNDPQIMYASVVHSQQGGIYKTTNLGAGPAAMWTKLPAPPRTEGHPLSILVLPDGALVCSFSGRRTEDGAFTPSSGVFYSADGGQSWQDRSHPDMFYWTKDLVVDPHDPTGNTWYAAVFSGWGGPANDKGGLFRSTDRGQSWTNILDLYRVESCALHPSNPNIMYVTTEDQGLWYTGNLTGPAPEFSQLEQYHFQHPMRVFFNPFDPNQVWVTSFGNGLQTGSTTATDQLNPAAMPETWTAALTPSLATSVLTLTVAASEPVDCRGIVLDARGREIQRPFPAQRLEAGNNKLSWSVDRLPPGAYFLRLLDGQGKERSLRFVKMPD